MFQLAPRSAREPLQFRKIIADAGSLSRWTNKRGAVCREGPLRKLQVAAGYFRPLPLTVVEKKLARTTLAAFTWAKEAAQVRTNNRRKRYCNSRYPKISQTSVIVRSRYHVHESRHGTNQLLDPPISRDHPAEGARATRDRETKARFSGFRNETSPFLIARSR